MGMGAPPGKDRGGGRGWSENAGYVGTVLFQWWVCRRDR